MIRSKYKPGSQGLGVLLLAFLCIALVILSGTIQVAHGHADGNLPHPDCALCATVHTAVLAAVPIVIQTAPELVAAVEIEPTPTGPFSLFIFSSYIRPPPVVLSSR